MQAARPTEPPASVFVDCLGTHSGTPDADAVLLINRRLQRHASKLCGRRGSVFTPTAFRQLTSVAEVICVEEGLTGST